MHPVDYENLCEGYTLTLQRAVVCTLPEDAGIIKDVAGEEKKVDRLLSRNPMEHKERTCCYGIGECIFYLPVQKRDEG